MLNDGYTYPSTVDALTQATITDWFQFRRVTDNAKFGTYFNRVLNRDYHRYRQLMRIEAGVQGDTGIYTNFDWLVTEYLERQEKREYNESRTESSTGLNETTKSGSTNTTHGGTTKLAIDDSGSTTHGLSTTTTNTSNSTSNTEENSNSGNTTETRAGALTRNQPNAQSYTSNEMNANDSRRGYITDTNNGFNVGEKVFNTGDTETDSSYTVALHRNFPDLDIKNPTSSSDAHTTVGAIASNKGESETTATDTTTGTTANSGTDRTTNTGEHITTHGETIGTTDTGTGRESTSGSSTGEVGSDGLTQTQHTGRNGEIADILTRAKAYIQSTSAWDWFRGQLETCFMACLD